MIDTPSDIFLVLELATNGTLFEKIVKNGKVSFKNQRNSPSESSDSLLV